jgi:hypothetical protein
LPGIADRWEVLKKVGVSVADKLSGEKARRTQRLVLEDEEGRLAESYAHLLALPKAVSEEAPEVPGGGDRRRSASGGCQRASATPASRKRRRKATRKDARE